MFRNIKEMPARQGRDAARVYVGPADTATAADLLRAAAKPALGKGLPRFDLRAELSEEEAAGVDDELYVEWAKMNLDDRHGWPLWEREMFLLLAKHYGELYSIFSFYAKSGGTGTSASSGSCCSRPRPNLALHRQIATPEFAMARVHLIMRMSDQGDREVVDPANARFAAAGAGDKALEMFEFLELLVRIALQRQNPKLGSVGHEHAVEEPLPGCLEYLLTEHILKFAQRDQLKETLEAMKADEGCIKAFADNQKALKKLFEAKASRRATARACSARW